MKYCSHCGGQLVDEAVVCIHCGCAVEAPYSQVNRSVRDNGINTVIKVFMIIGCIASLFFLIPLAWKIPITVNIIKKMNAGEPITTGWKVAALLLVNMIAGICLLCVDQQ